MIINRFKPTGTTNFGDALNDYLWPRILNPRFTQIPGQFYGIGTVLADNHPKDVRHVVFGSGAGYKGIPTLDDTWKIYFVRGPYTGELLGGVQSITDPAILIKGQPRPIRTADYSCAFMPRWDSMSPDLVVGCGKAGIKVIDPRWSVETVMGEIVNTDLLLAEAMHGAIVADALRVPWVSIYGNRGHEFKWKDWCWSMGMVWNPIDMAEFTLTWAKLYAVPQLSAASVLNSKYEEMCAALKVFNHDLETM